MDTLGDRLRKLRKSKNLTQEEMGKHFNIVKSTISQYENNINVPDIDMLNNLADFFGVSVDYLLGRNDTINLKDEKVILKQAEDAFKVDPDMLITMCRAVDLPEEERKRIKEYSAYVIEKFLREKAEKEKQGGK